MRILLTNDDGYNVGGILLLREELKRYGEVILVAPKVVQSAKSCAITIGPLNIEKVDELTYAVEGTPIDCILFGLCHFEGIDLIVSGCNNSPNMGVDTIYSGTCAACTQALIANKPAISFSCAGKDYFSQITKFSKYALDYIFDNNLLSTDYFLNVNFPDGKYEDIKGINLTKLFYQRIKYQTGSYENGVFLSHRKMDMNINDLSYDVGSFNEGYISITPLSTSNFNLDVFNKVAKEIE